MRIIIHRFPILVLLPSTCVYFPWWYFLMLTHKDTHTHTWTIFLSLLPSSNLEMIKFFSLLSQPSGSWWRELHVLGKSVIDDTLSQKLMQINKKSPIFNIVLMIVHTAMFLIFQITVHCAVGFLHNDLLVTYICISSSYHIPQKKVTEHIFFGIVNKRKSPWLTIRNLCIFFSFREEQQQPGFLLPKCWVLLSQKVEPKVHKA